MLFRKTGWFCLAASWACLWLSMALSTASVYGQQTTGTIFGRVTDPEGAVISDIGVEVTNKETGWSRKVKTNGDGDFIALLLPVGTYTLKAERGGFKSFVRQGIQLSVDANVRIDIRMEIGESTETVTISDDAGQVDTSTSAVSHVVNQKLIVDLPLNGRNFLQLGLILPGVVPLTALQSTAQGGLAADQGFSVNGLPTRSNRFMIDGASNNDVYNSGSALRPPPDALQEFSIITNSFSAEFGQSAGSIVNIITRAGSNQFHGGIYEFLRNDALDARNFFARGVPPLKQNQFGGTLGGPVIRNKTHFFTYFEGFRNRQGLTRGTTVPTSEQRQGNLSSLSSFIRDPLKSGLCQATPASPQPGVNYQAACFAGSIIPADRINSISKKYLDMFPLPTGARGAYTSFPSLQDDRNQFGARIDHAWSASNNLYGRYIYSDLDSAEPLRAPVLVPGFGITNTRRAQSVLLTDTHIVSPNVINELRFNYLRSRFSNSAPVTRSSLSSLGFAYPTTASDFEGPATLNITGFSSIGNPDSGPNNNRSETYQIAEKLSWVRGRHSLSFGFDLRRNIYNSVLTTRPNGVFDFQGALTGNAFADFLLGLPTVFTQFEQTDRTWTTWSYNAFIQDNFRIFPRLTLNLGLRYELNTPLVEEEDRMAAFAPGQKSTQIPAAPAGLLYPGDTGVARGIVETDKNNFAPRLGFAWDVFGNGRTSVRGGYGISYDAIFGNAQLQGFSAPPFFKTVVIVIPKGFADPYTGTRNPFLGGDFGFTTPIAANFLNPELATPYAQSWNLTVEHELPANLIAEISYVGTKGTKLIRNLQVNPAIFGPGATTANTNARRTRFGPTFAGVTLISSESSSSYNALQTGLSRRFATGLALRVNYTWSKSIDFLSYYNAAGNPGESQTQISAANLKLDRGRSAFEQRHRFIVSLVYDLPFGKNLTGPLGVMAKGWQVNTIGTINSGVPFSVFEPVDVSLTGLANRPNLIGDPNDGPKTVEKWFNTSAFQRLTLAANAGQIGTAGRNIVTGPGYHNWDLGLIKNTRFGDNGGLNLQFRVELFNAFNHANFLLPEFNISSPNFGVIQNAQDGRVIQLALKFNF